MFWLKSGLCIQNRFAVKATPQKKKLKKNLAKLSTNLVCLIMSINCWLLIKHYIFLCWKRVFLSVIYTVKKWWYITVGNGKLFCAENVYFYIRNWWISTFSNLNFHYCVFSTHFSKFECSKTLGLIFNVKKMRQHIIKFCALSQMQNFKMSKICIFTLFKKLLLFLKRFSLR